MGGLSRPPAFTTRTRERIKARSGGRCERCSGHGREYAHRRGRGVRDEHTGCTCNACWLCRTCHRELTLNPDKALREGFQVSKYQDEPWTVPVQTVAGWVYLDCEGGWTPLQ